MAFRIAIGDLFSNIHGFDIPITKDVKPVILAGLDYDRPWTRDAAINSWNAGSYIIPEIAKNTLLSVLVEDKHGLRIGGQYWDAVVWITGAWNHYLYTGDREFLKLAFEASNNSLVYLEKQEFNSEYNLFMGPGWSDGVAAYPGIYGDSGGESAIYLWPEYHPDKVSVKGFGIPMMALSTNCLYYNAYIVANNIAEELGHPVNQDFTEKAKKIKEAINTHLWNEKKGMYHFFIGPFGNCDNQETLGNAYAILFGIADERQKQVIIKNSYVAPHGIPCGWPDLERYNPNDTIDFGRHSATVWPQIQGFWAQICADAKMSDNFGHEFLKLAEHACRDLQFAEIYHPNTGAIYGGLQENNKQGIIPWWTAKKQTWAATTFIKMFVNGMAGIRIEKDGVYIEPCVPEEINKIRLNNLQVRDLNLDVNIQGHGNSIQSIKINGKEVGNAFIPFYGQKKNVIEIVL
ncbi:MGH1-like glycoside hydrolase domain-containing protein [Maribellus luteus]|nr:amylo-alpha-1,6-glucosidase [Maribellus luteus]